MAKYNRISNMKLEMRAKTQKEKSEGEILTKTPINSQKTMCISCGFEAYYKFKICPHCDVVQE